MLRPVFSATLGLTLVGLLGCNVTSDGSVGDPLSEPNSNVLGNGSRIREVVEDPTWLTAEDPDSDNCDSPPERPVSTTGQVVVAIDRYDETGEGAVGNLYIQDVYAPDEEILPKSGMTVFAPSFSPPDLRLFEEDVVDVFGNLIEFLGPSTSRFGECKTLPEILGTMTLRFDGGSLRPITLVSENGGDARWEKLVGYSNARQWMGMLVRVEGVRIIGTPSSSSGRYNADIDMGNVEFDEQISLSNELFDLENESPEPLEDGVTFKAVTGVLTYFYAFRIAPRGPEDFEL
jgi:hypothetical protein